MIKVKIVNIFTDNNKSPIVVLEEIDSEPKRKLLIWIGESEAYAIKSGLDKKYSPRPMTHDLIKNIIDAFSATVASIFINTIEKSTFYLSSRQSPML